MREFVSEPNEESRASVLKHRLILTAVVVGGLSLGHWGRIYFPAPVEIAQQKLSEVEQLHDSAFQSYQSLIGRHASGEITQAELADAIELTPLSQWRDAEAKLAELRPLNMKGDIFNLVCQKVSGCRRSAELLTLAIRNRDDSLQSESKAAWREAKAASAELSALRERFAAAEPPSPKAVMSGN